MLPRLTAAAETRTLAPITTVPVRELTTTRATGSAGLTSIFSTIETRLMRWLASIGADTWIDTASSGEAAPGPSVPLIASATRLLVVKSRSEEHTSELQSLMRTSYAVF